MTMYVRVPEKHAEQFVCHMAGLGVDAIEREASIFNRLTREPADHREYWVWSRDADAFMLAKLTWGGQ